MQMRNIQTKETQVKKNYIFNGKRPSRWLFNCYKIYVRVDLHLYAYQMKNEPSENITNSGSYNFLNQIERHNSSTQQYENF